MEATKQLSETKLITLVIMEAKRGVVSVVCNWALYSEGEINPTGVDTWCESNIELGRANGIHCHVGRP